MPTQNDITVVTRIDHAANADGVGMELGPTQVLMFANPALGTQLMQSERTIGVDLPLKAIAWEDENGQVWLGFADPANLAERYGIEDEAELAGNMSQAVRGFVEEAAAE